MTLLRCESRPKTMELMVVTVTINQVFLKRAKRLSRVRMALVSLSECVSVKGPVENTCQLP